MDSFIHHNEIIHPKQVGEVKLDAVIAQHIIEQIATCLNTDLWIVDLLSHVLASTQSNNPHSQPESMEVHYDARHNRHLRLPLCYADKQVGTLIIGSLALRNQATAQMAKTIAELIIYQAAMFGQLADRQGVLNKFIYHLLQGQVQDNLALILQEASLLQIDLAIPRVVVVLDLTSLFSLTQATLTKPSQGAPRHLHEWQQLRRRILYQVNEHFPVRGANLAAFSDENYLVILAAIDLNQSGKWCQQLKYLVQRTLDELSCMTDKHVWAGIGDYHLSWQSLPSSYDDACIALKIGHALSDSAQVFTIPDLGLAAFVCAGNPTLSSKLAARLLTPLQDEAELLSTLETFLALNLSPSQAAKKLSIHRHTLIYRLQKIVDLTGADPRDFHDATQFLAALLWQKCEQPAG